MTIASAIARNTYTLNGSTTVYPYTYRTLNAADLRVITRSALGVETVLVRDVDYVVSGAGNTSGGAITLTSAGPAGDTLIIRRNRTITQPTSLANQGRGTQAAIEAALDAGIVIAQSLQDQLDHALRIDETLDPALYDLTLPEPTAGKVLAGTGSGFTMSTLDSSAVALPGQGRTVATLSAYLANNARYNIKDYGADATGVVAAQTAINAAITAANAGGGGVVYVPPGIYKLTGQITLLTNVRLVGSGCGSTTFQYTLAGGNGVYGSGLFNAEVEDITFQGTLSIGVFFSNCTRVAVRRCYFSGITDSTSASNYCGGVFAVVSDDVTIEGNVFVGNGTITVGKLSSDIQINGSGANTGSTGVRIVGNRCRSVAVQTNIVAYDIQRSEISGNVCTGAKTNALNSNGYGIAIYRTTANTGVMQDTRIIGNCVYSVGGTGIYVQSAPRTVVSSNVIFDAGAVQSDTTLAVGGIAFSNSQDSTCSNNIIMSCAKSGIAVAGIARGMLQGSGQTGGCDGFTITGNTIDTVTGYGIAIRGPMWRSTISGNSILSPSLPGIATFPSQSGRPFSDGVTTNGSPTVTSATAMFSPNDIGIQITGTGIPANTTIIAVASTTSITMSANATATATGVSMVAGGLSGCTITGNTIEAAGARAIDIYSIARSVIAKNTITRSGGDGIGIVQGSYTRIANNIIADGGTVASGVYTGITVTNLKRSSIAGNHILNAGSTGYAYAVAADTLSTNLTIADNEISGMLTAPLSLVATSTTVIRNNGGYNPVGALSVTVTASPMTYTAGASPEVVYIMGGTVTSVTRSGGTIATATNCHIPLPPNQSIVVTYTVAPTMAKDVQ